MLKCLEQMRVHIFHYILAYIATNFKIMYKTPVFYYSLGYVLLCSIPVDTTNNFPYVSLR